MTAGGVFRRLSVALCAAALPMAMQAPVAAASTRSVSPSGNDAGSCASLPCRTLDYAYRQSQPGDVVQLAGGSYPDQDIGAVAGRGAPAVDFRPAPGASVTLNNLDVGASYVTLRSLKIANILDVTGQSAPAVGVSAFDVSGPQLYVQNVRSFTVTGGGWGPRTDKQPVIVGSSPESYDVTFDGVDFHDALVSNSSVHTECAMVLNVQGLAIRNSIFRNCTYFGLMLADLYGNLDPSDTTLENNVFEVTRQSNGDTAPFSMIVGPIQARNFVIRNNTFQTEPAFNNTTFSNSRFVGNIAPVSSCYGGLAYAYNVFTSLTCSGTDKKSAGAMSQFRNPGAHDWRLAGGAAAIDAASPTDHPATDRSGTPRGSNASAGAYEPNSSSPAPPGGGDAPSGGTDSPSPGSAAPPAAPTATSAASLGLVGAWSFDERRGSRARDASGNHNTATISGARHTKGRFGRGLAFNGRNSLVTVRGTRALNLRRAMTLEAWVKPTARASIWRSVVVKEQGGGRRALAYALYAADGGGFATGHAFVGADAKLRSRSPLPLRRWTHLATTWDGTVLRLYVNGRAIASQPLSGLAADAPDGALRIGGNRLWREWFRGTIDEVRVYDRALGAARIRADRRRPITHT